MEGREKGREGDLLQGLRRDRCPCRQLTGPHTPGG